MNAITNRVHQQIRVETPIAHAFELACQADRQREWNPYMEYFHVVEPLDHVGSTFDVVLDLVGQSTSCRGTVLDVSPPQSTHFRLVAEHETSDWWYRFEAIDGATLFSIEVAYEKEGVFAGVVDRLVYHGGLERAVRHMTENFAALAPARTPALA